MGDLYLELEDVWKDDHGEEGSGRCGLYGDQKLLER